MRRKNASFRRLVWCVLLAAATVLNPIFASVAQASETSSVVIGEVAWAGSTLSTADEWIEIWNVSDAPVAIGNWSLRGMGESGRLIPLPADAVVPARGTYVVANYGPGETKSDLATEPQVVTTTVSLSNSALRIDLVDAAGNLVDSAGTGGAPPAGSSGAAKITMVRTDIRLAGATPTAWSDQTAGANLKPGTPDLGTPGVCDACAASGLSPENPAEPVATTSTVAVEPGPDIATTTTSDATSSVTEPSAASSAQPDVVQEPASGSTEIILDATTTASVDSAGPTSTLPIVDAPTSTGSGAASASSTASESISPPMLQAATVPAVAQDAVSDATTPPAERKPPYGMLRLNEISPYPPSGKEWVEIASLDGANAIPLKGCELHDRQGRLLTIGAVTLDPSQKPYVVIELSSSRLNNDGDMVALYCDSHPIDAMNYGSSAKGETWIRLPDKTGPWRQSAKATPAAENIAASAETPAMPAKSPATTPILKPTAPKTVSVSKASVAEKSASATVTADGMPKYQPITEDYPSLEDLLDSAEYADDEGSPASKSPAAEKSAKTTNSKKSAENPIIPFTFDMLNDFDNSPIRVRLEGAVGSTAGLLPYHSFVLLSPEGRGLQVRVPTGKKLPEMNLMVSVTGNLLVDDRGRPYLKMTAKDELLLGLPVERLTPRIVDIELPANEDAWAYMSVTGTVKSVKARNITLDLDGVELVMAIKPSVRYRPQRLVAGDVIRAVGLLDLTGDEPRLLPRSADDISLLKHAEVKTAAAPASGPTVPGWVPFGAAAGAVALTEGTKHYRKRRQRKILERKLDELTSVTA